MDNLFLGKFINDRLEIIDGCFFQQIVSIHNFIRKIITDKILM